MRWMLEALLWSAALGCAAVSISSARKADAAEQLARAIHPQVGAVAAKTKAKVGSVMGRLEIKQVGLSAPVLESYDPDTLTRGVGHVPGTALPGGLGNVVLAGHRDTFFRGLRRIQPDMAIDLSTSDGTWRYNIDRTEVVTPDEVRVLEIGDRPELTLITCFPFEYIGAAPKRFIVHAHLLSLTPTGPQSQ